MSDSGDEYKVHAHLHELGREFVKNWGNDVGYVDYKLNGSEKAIKAMTPDGRSCCVLAYIAHLLQKIEARTIAASSADGMLAVLKRTTGDIVRTDADLWDKLSGRAKLAIEVMGVDKLREITEWRMLRANKERYGCCGPKTKAEILAWKKAAAKTRRKRK